MCFFSIHPETHHICGHTLTPDVSGVRRRRLDSSFANDRPFVAGTVLCGVGSKPLTP